MQKTVFESKMQDNYFKKLTNKIEDKPLENSKVALIKSQFIKVLS